jgi:hypothetical protein
MDSAVNKPSPLRDLSISRPADISVGQLVGEVYASSPAPERSRLLEFLLRPLGVLALVTIADGIFAKIRFRSGWPDPHVALEDANRVQPGDIAALVDRVQQVSTDAVDGLASIVAGSPVIASSAAAAMLVALLVQRERTRRATEATTPHDPDFEPPR